MSSSGTVFEKFRAVGFRVGPHKAFQVARDAARVKIILVSSMPADLVSQSADDPCSQSGRGIYHGAAAALPHPTRKSSDSNSSPRYQYDTSFLT